MASEERPAVHGLFVTAQAMDDEDRLVAIRSTASALRKEEEELVQRLKEKAVVEELENKLEKYASRVETAEQTAATMHSERDAAIKRRQDAEAEFKRSLLSAQEEVEAVNSKHNKLATELAIRDSALADCHKRNNCLVEELVSYRAQCHTMDGANAAFREQHEAQAIRGARMVHRLRSLEHHSRTQEATICALLQEVQAKGMRVPPPNMHGPVGGPNRKDFISSYAPGYGSNTHPVTTCGPMPSCGPYHMPGYATQQLPAEQPQWADAMEQIDKHSASASDAAQSGHSCHTAHASTYSQAAADSEAVVEDGPELAKEFSFGDSLQEPLLEPAFVSKLEKKDVCDSQTEAEGTTVKALRSVDLTFNSVPAPNPPVQASRGGSRGVDTTTAGQELQEPNAATAAADNGVAPVTSSATVQTTAAAEASEAPIAPPPPPPRKLIYVTPVLPGHAATLSTEEQQSYQEALHRVALSQSPTGPTPLPAGMYVTPMPAQLNNSSTSSSAKHEVTQQSVAYEVLEQRTNRRSGARASRIGHDAEVQSTSGASCSTKQPDVNSLGAASSEATAPEAKSKQAKKRARKSKKKKASQSPATAGNQR